MFDVLSLPLQHYANNLAKEGLKIGHKDVKLGQKALEQGNLALGQGHLGLDLNRHQLELAEHEKNHDTRLLDEKVKQLEIIANLSALIGGFEMIVLVESQLPDSLAASHERLMVLFSGTAAAGVATMLTAMLISSYTLFRLLDFRSSYEHNKKKYYCIHGRNTPFDITVWEGRAHFKPAWLKAFKFFQIGVPCFMMNLIVLGWIKFEDSVASCMVVSFIVSFSILFWMRFLALTYKNTPHFERLPQDVNLCHDCPSSLCCPTRPACLDCHKELRLGSRFCSGCGSSHVSKLHTCQCGHVLTTSARFCDMCGHPRDGLLSHQTRIHDSEQGSNLSGFGDSFSNDSGPSFPVRRSDSIGTRSQASSFADPLNDENYVPLEEGRESSRGAELC